MTMSSTPESGMFAESKARILVADDDPVMRTFVRAILATDYDIVEVRDGGEAIARLDGDATFDLVLADDRMPIATGFDVAAYVRDSDRLRHVPVILMTAKETSTAARQAESRAVRAVAFLNKPFTRIQLRTLVDAIVRGRRVRRPA
jgi:CheY-like chemotaxis protein